MVQKKTRLSRLDSHFKEGLAASTGPETGGPWWGAAQREQIRGKRGSACGGNAGEVVLEEREGGEDTQGTSFLQAVLRKHSPFPVCLNLEAPGVRPPSAPCSSSLTGSARPPGPPGSCRSHRRKGEASSAQSEPEGGLDAALSPQCLPFRRAWPWLVHVPFSLLPASPFPVPYLPPPNLPFP